MFLLSKFLAANFLRLSFLAKKCFLAEALIFRAPDYESEGRRFESSLARSLIPPYESRLYGGSGGRLLFLPI